MTITEAPPELGATISAPPDVINAIDAPSGLGVHDVPMPASPLNLWNEMHAAQGGSQ